MPDASCLFVTRRMIDSDIPQILLKSCKQEASFYLLLHCCSIRCTEKRTEKEKKRRQEMVDLAWYSNNNGSTYYNSRKRCNNIMSCSYDTNENALSVVVSINLKIRRHRALMKKISLSHISGASDKYSAESAQMFAENAG